MDSLYRLARQSVPAFVERKKKLIGSQLPRIGGRWLVGWVKREKKRARQLGKTPLKMKFAVKKKETWPFFVQLCWKKLVEGRPIDFHRRARAKTKKKTKNKSKNKEKVKRERKKRRQNKRGTWGAMSGGRDGAAGWCHGSGRYRRYRSTISIEDISISMPQRRTVATGRVARKWKQNRAPLNSNPFQSALNAFPMRRTQENPVKPSNTHGNSK